MATLIVITGVPGSGKTTLANSLRTELGLPLFAKDTFKQKLSEAMPGSGLEWSRSLGRAAIVSLKLVTEEFAVGSGVCIVESVFRPKLDDPFFASLTQKGTSIIQLFCSVPGPIAYDRVRYRLESGNRHFCHQDHLRMEEHRAFFDSNDITPLSIRLTKHLDGTKPFDMVPLLAFLKDNGVGH